MTLAVPHRVEAAAPGFRPVVQRSGPPGGSDGLSLGQWELTLQPGLL